MSSGKLHFAKIWESNANLVGDSPALINDSQVVSWSEYESQASKIANFLQVKGLKQDSKVGIYLHNCNEFLIAQFGVFKMGGCPINVNYRYKEDELVYLLDNSDAEAVFSLARALRSAPAQKPRPAPVKMMALISSSASAASRAEMISACICPV